MECFSIPEPSFIVVFVYENKIIVIASSILCVIIYLFFLLFLFLRYCLRSIKLLAFCCSFLCGLCGKCLGMALFSAGCVYLFLVSFLVIIERCDDLH
jgi:hypothetical protein